MKYLKLLNFTFGLLICGCIDGNRSHVSITNNTGTIKSFDDSRDKDKIQNLIRKMLKWSDSKGMIDLLPALEKNGICIGFDFDKVNRNLETLKATGLFADAFIDNYKRILQTLDKKIKNKELEVWNINELPTFNFANGVNPWCLCQDHLSWDDVAIEIIKLDNDQGEIKWNWGKLDSNADSGWKDFSYVVRIVKVNNQWKISYLQGFDYNESTT